MGQAKRRGTYEQRRAQALREKQQALDDLEALADGSPDGLIPIERLTVKQTQMLCMMLAMSNKRR